MRRVLVLGYHHRNNIGDDVFTHVFKNSVLQDYNTTVINMEDLDKVCKQIDQGTMETFDRIIIGAGDLVNDYFLSSDNISLLQKYFGQTPIYFVGIGITYADKLSLLDVGDHFYVRNKQDLDAVKYRFGNANVKYMPDLAFLMNPNIESIPNNTATKNVGICLPFTWIANSKKNHSKLLEQLKNLIVTTVKVLKCNVHVIPFDTSNDNLNSDIKMLQRLRDLCGDAQYDGERQCIFYHDTLAQPTDLASRIQNFVDVVSALDIVIAARFHSAIFSILCEKPFVALSSTPKMQKLCHDMGSQFARNFVSMQCDQDGVPTEFDVDHTIDSVKYMMDNQTMVSLKVKEFKTAQQQQVQSSLKHFQNTLKKGLRRQTPPQYISNREKEQLFTSTIQSVLQKIRFRISQRDIDRLRSGGLLRDIVPRQTNSDTSQIRRIITEEVLYNITGDPYAPYYYGLFDNILDIPFRSQVLWMIEDYYTKYKYKFLNDGNIQIVNFNFQELHRSGWQFIVNNLVVELNQQVNTIPLIVDTYVDKTFHWNQEFYKLKGVIPYTQDWVGFIHHTFSDYNNQYNCMSLFTNKHFIQSLEKCQCLIVMTNYLKQQIQDALEELYSSGQLHNKVAVEVIYHPSEQAENLFSWDNFVDNENRKVVQIGNWLRNVYSIYALQLSKSSFVTGKVVVKNKNSEAYFLPNGFFTDLAKYLNIDESSFDGVMDICKISSQNMHVKGMFEHLVDNEKSVETLEYLNNEQYDDLLSKNVVFINLVDASAVNTLVECILRHTPILVNPIEPVVEVLGEDYPLYYTTVYEASKLLEDNDKLKKGYDYLVKMDKTRFYIDTFVHDISQVFQRVVESILD